MTLTGHGWDAKTCDWHPTKGLLVSGSKDHQVKFWEPRTGRCLTTLHTHKNTVTATRFSRVNHNLLATSSRDQTARVFDLRMMRDICILRGHEKPISSMTWHPIHSSLISTGSEDGSLFHYLLDEPNLPPGQVPTVAPYDTTDPENTPPQVIFPAHRIQYAHGSTIWSLDWHPLGHILASGSKDNFTRFWSRARPGETSYMKDRFHIGEEAAEAQGTWSRGFGRRQLREEEEEEMQDEAEGLVEQRNPEALLPGVQPPPPPGGSGSDNVLPGLIPGIGSMQPPPQQSGPPQMPASIPQMDSGRLAALLASGQFQTTGQDTNSIPGIMGSLPQNLNFPGLQGQAFPPMSLNQNIPPQGGSAPSIPGLQGNSDGFR